MYLPEPHKRMTPSACAGICAGALNYEKLLNGKVDEFCVLKNTLVVMHHSVVIGMVDGHTTNTNSLMIAQ